MAKQRRAKQKKSSLTNNNVETSTELSMLYDIHYNELNIVNRWGRERIQRLCDVMKVSSFELASVIRMPHTEMKAAMTKGSPLHGSACVLLSEMEKHMLSKYTKDVIAGNIIPYDESKISSKAWS